MSDNNRNNILNCNEQKRPTAFVPMPYAFHTIASELRQSYFILCCCQPAYYDRIRRTQRAPTLFLLFHTDLFIQLVCNFSRFSFFRYPHLCCYYNTPVNRLGTETHATHCGHLIQQHTEESDDVCVIVRYAHGYRGRNLLASNILRGRRRIHLATCVRITHYMRE